MNIQPKSYGPNELLIKPGDPATHMYGTHKRVLVDTTTCLPVIVIKHCLTCCVVSRSVPEQVSHQAGSGCKAGSHPGKEHVLRRRLPADVVLPTVRRSNADVHGLLSTGEHRHFQAVPVRTVPQDAGLAATLLVFATDAAVATAAVTAVSLASSLELAQRPVWLVLVLRYQRRVNAWKFRLILQSKVVPYAKAALYVHGSVPLSLLSRSHTHRHM
jgi:hypothetical protein